MEKSIYSSEYDHFLRLLKAERIACGMTQIELAKKLASTQTLVSKCERGERRLDIVELRHWCVALGTSLEAFSARFDHECMNISDDFRRPASG